MPPVKTRSNFKKHEPYPLSEISRSVIKGLAKRFVHLRAIGHADMGGDMFSQFFAEAINGQDYAKPLGVADVAWNGCCWSVKTVKQDNPHDTKIVRLISGRNAPFYSAGIVNHLKDIQRTGRAVLKIYNQRIDEAREEHDDVRLLVLVRNMATLEFTLFERALTPLSITRYAWRQNARKNLEAYEEDRHCFTWQPHGAQFTIVEQVPLGAHRFRMKKQPAMVSRKAVLDLTKYSDDWIEWVLVPS